jgi:hypothetical protein
MRYTLILLLLLLTQCKQENREKEFRIGKITLTLPADIRIDTVPGIDSKVFFFINNSGDTFNIEYGQSGIIYDLFEPMPVVFAMKEKALLKQNFNVSPTDDQALFSNSPQQDMQQNIFDKNYYRYDTINNIIVKIVQPKQAGNGMTGMYIPLLKDSSSFSIYALNLKTKENEAAIRFFKTLHYK